LQLLNPNLTVLDIAHPDHWNSVRQVWTRLKNTIPGCPGVVEQARNLNPFPGVGEVRTLGISKGNAVLILVIAGLLSNRRRPFSADLCEQCARGFRVQVLLSPVGGEAAGAGGGQGRLPEPLQDRPHPGTPSPA